MILKSTFHRNIAKTKQLIVPASFVRFFIGTFERYDCLQSNLIKEKCKKILRNCVIREYQSYGDICCTDRHKQYEDNM